MNDEIIIGSMTGVNEVRTELTDRHLIDVICVEPGVGITTKQMTEEEFQECKRREAEAREFPTVTKYSMPTYEEIVERIIALEEKMEQILPTLN